VFYKLLYLDKFSLLFFSEPKSEIEIVQMYVFAKAGHTAWNFFTKKKKFKRWTFVVAIG
jgi:hypothetical protein